jgi:photosystem II stability/assembly factor-like uncharacterized protein
MSIPLMFPLLSKAQTWTNLEIYGGQIYRIAIDPANPDKMFAGSYLGDGLFITTDGGNNWQPVLTGQEGGQLDREATFRNTAVWDVEISPSPYNKFIWVAHENWVEKSDDGGQTWTHVSNDMMQGGDMRYCWSIAIDPSASQNTVYVGTGGPMETNFGGAVYKTQDFGMTWRKMNKGADFDYTVVDIAVDPNNNNVVWAVTSDFGAAGNAGSLYRSEDGGESWINIMTIGSGFSVVAVNPGDSNIVYTGSGFGIVKHFYDGNNWQYLWPVIPETVGCRLVRDIQFDPRNPNIIYAAWRNPWFGDFLPKISRSTTGGNVWETYTVDYQFFALAVHPKDSQVIFGGELSLGVFKSQDHGQTWTPMNNGINAVNVRDVAVDPNDKTHLLAASSIGVCERRGSATWSVISDFPYHAAYSVEFDPKDGQTFYAGIEGHLAKTTDGGATWTFSNGLDAYDPYIYNYVSDIAVDPMGNGKVFIAVNGFENYGEVYKSANGGEWFDKVLDGQNQSGENYTFNVVAIDPSNRQRVFAGGGNFYSPKVLGDLWMSGDGGNSWSRSSLTNVIVNALLVNPNNDLILYAGCGYSEGAEVPVYKSTDGGSSWSASFNGIPSMPGNIQSAVTDLKFHRQNTNVLYASTNAAGIYVSPNQGNNWLKLGTPDYDVYAIAPSSLYAATKGGLLQCTGTGVIAGQVSDAVTGANIDNAMVFNDFGVKTMSVNGEYMMVTPVGDFSVTAVKDGYANKSMGNVRVYGGDVSWANMSMEAGVSDPTAIGLSGGGDVGGGG